MLIKPHIYNWIHLFQKKPKKEKVVVRTEQDDLDDFFGESTPKEVPGNITEFNIGLSLFPVSNSCRLS